MCLILGSNVTRYQGNLRVTRVTGHVARQYFPTTLASVPGEVDIPGTHGRASGSGQAEPVTLAPSRLLLQSSDTAYLYNNNYTIITGRHRHTSKRRSHTRANHQLSRGARGAQPPTHLLNMCSTIQYLLNRCRTRHQVPTLQGVTSNHPPLATSATC